MLWGLLAKIHRSCTDFCFKPSPARASKRAWTAERLERGTRADWYLGEAEKELGRSFTSLGISWSQRKPVVVVRRAWLLLLWRVVDFGPCARKHSLLRLTGSYLHYFHIRTQLYFSAWPSDVKRSDYQSGVRTARPATWRRWCGRWQGTSGWRWSRRVGLRG